MATNRKAFSLVELTIVLLVMAALMALIIKGRDLIENVRMQRDFSAHVERLYKDFYKYHLLSIELRGYDGVLADAKENGGYEETVDGFIDTDTDDKRVDSLYSLSTTTSEVNLLYNYDGTETPYTEDSKITDYLRRVDPLFLNFFMTGDTYSYKAYGGSIVKVIFGADKSGENQGNILVFYDINSLELARIYDRMMDDEINGTEGKIILLGYRYSGACSPRTTSTCTCSSGVCLAKGVDEGCEYPLCSPTDVKEIAIGVKVD